jgi:ketosteroid isomerase-like protein
MSASDTVVDFMQAINARDLERIVSLCAEDHTFVDAHGGKVDAGGVAAAWRGYFQFMPHYLIEAETIIGQGQEVAVFGWASGGLDAADPDAKCWRRPCAWRARVRDGRVCLWQVYVDTKAVFDLI